MIPEIYMKSAILLWRFSESPFKFQELSEHGGDEDWLAYSRDEAALDEAGAFLLAEGAAFGCCSVSKRKSQDGWVLIGAHA